MKVPGPLYFDCKSWYHPRNNLNDDGGKNQKYFFTRSISNFQLWPGMGKFCTGDETLWASFCMNFLETLGILFIPGHKKMFTFFQRHLYRAMSRYKVPERNSLYASTIYFDTIFAFLCSFVSELPRLLHLNYSSQFNCQQFCCKKAPSEGKIWNNCQLKWQSYFTSVLFRDRSYLFTILSDLKTLQLMLSIEM